MTYRLVIFDFDGTLADTFPWFVGVLNGVAARYGFRSVTDHAEMEALRGLTNREIIAHLQVPAWKLPLIARHMRRLAAEGADGMRLFAGTEAVLRDLRAAGVRIAVVSSNQEETVRRVLGPELAGLVDLYACGASLFGKAAKFRTVLRTLGVPPDQALCIGDEVRDAEAAAKAGIPFGAVAWGFARLDALTAQRPQEVFASMSEIPARVIPAR